MLQTKDALTVSTALLTMHLHSFRKSKHGGSTELEKLAKAPIDDFTPTPFNMATKQTVPEFISQTMERLTDKLAEFEVAVRNSEPAITNAELNEVVNRLQQKLTDAHAIISEQDQLLQASLVGPPSISSSTCQIMPSSAKSKTGLARGMLTSPGGSLDLAAEEIENERRALAIQKKNMEHERQILQEQAMKLDQDRLEFEVD